MPYATASDGTRLYYKDWGAGRRTTIVMIHGWPLCADMFDYAAMEFAEGTDVRVIAPDRRGFGRSDQNGQGYDYDVFAEDIDTILSAAGAARPVVLLGFSMGGGEVARFISRHPGDVSHAILVASVVPYMLQAADNPDGIPSEVFERMIAALRDDRAQFLHDFFPGFFGAGKVSQGVLDDAWRQAMTAALWPTIQCVWAFSHTDFRPDLPNFTMPTLLIHGSQDDIVPIGLTSRLAAAAIPESKLVEYRYGSHGLFGGAYADSIIDDVGRFLGLWREGDRSPKSHE